MMYAEVRSSQLEGIAAVPGSKSHTIRALLIASLADGESRISAPLRSSDTISCIDTCRALGADIIDNGDDITIRGTGGNIRQPGQPIDVGNSGTTLYLAVSIAALGKGSCEFTGDEQIQKRPIGPLLNSLNDLGASAASRNGSGCAPVMVSGPLRGGDTSIECPTSQYLSSLLISAPLAEEETRIIVPLLHEKPYVEITLRWLLEQGIFFDNDDFRAFTIPGKQSYKPFTKRVPGDFSSATFLFCAAAVTGSTLTIEGLDLSDSQGDKEVIPMLEKMGCTFTECGGTIEVTGPDRRRGETLKGAELDLNATPDALPAMAVAACFASGTTRLVNVPQARLKETDRIAVMTRELSKMGADISETDDGLIIRGKKQDENSGLPGLSGAEVHGHGDHRVVMSLSVAGLAASGTTIVDTAETARITYPGFFDALRGLGASVTLR